MSRRNAAKVVAVDRCDFSNNINQINNKLSANILYYPNIKQTELVEFLRNKGFDGFDVVINSGLLYHVYGPLNSLAYTRSLVRTGGIVVVETAVAVQNTFSMHFNAAGKYYDDPTTFWFISIPCLDYMLRMLRLKPLECEFLATTEEGKLIDGIPVTRLAVACRAVDEILNDPDDKWMQQLYISTDYLDYTDWNALSKMQREPVGYMFSGKRVKTRQSSDVCNLWEQYANSEPLKPVLDQIRLSLGSTK
jgi:SAM-dependent methyltransferase